MKINFRKVMERVFDNGVDRGWYRAHKHMGAPSESQVKAEIIRALEAELYEWFDQETDSESSF